MKLLFGSMLLLNVAMFMWGSWYEAPPTGTVVDRRSPVNADKLRVLSAAAGVPSAKSTGPRLQPWALRAVGSKRVCASVGPFPSVAMVRGAQSDLADLDLEHRQRQEVKKTVASYRVYLPPQVSRQAAQDKRKQLTRMGFKDHYIIDEPGRKNAVSLGVFAVERNAWILGRKLAEKGISAKQETLHHTETVYWLDLEFGQEATERFTQLEWESPRVRIWDRACKENGSDAPDPSA
ncbi:MAG: hypothetical protein O7B27_00055 [Gammaproteobacteria bacterium]|nr:SPOR domain-containing protein [Pseudomonadota bacterium]MCZ6730938.1 hypothetical protein [Gammaproteobacteria bacterium]